MSSSSAACVSPKPLYGQCGVCESDLTGVPKVRLVDSCLLECAACGSWMYWPVETAAEQEALHDSAEYFDHPYFRLRRQITDQLRRRCRYAFDRIREALGAATFEGCRVLDIGCDTGTFLRCAKELFGIVPVGLDVSARSVLVAQREGIEAYRASIETAPEHLSGFSVITAVDLIEHLENPGSFLAAVRRRLEPGGVLYLETPNIASFIYAFGSILCNVLRGHPRAIFDRLFPPQHIRCFTLNSLRMLAEKNGFEVVEIGARRIPAADISASWPVRTVVAAIQTIDHWRGSEILIWTTLRPRQMH